MTLPIGGSAPVTGTANVEYRQVQGNPAPGSSGLNIYSTPGSAGYRDPFLGTEDGGGVNPFSVELQNDNVVHDLTADLTGATASDVRDIRVAFALQRYEEARAMYGSRYVEYLRYLGIRPSDARPIS